MAKNTPPRSPGRPKGRLNNITVDLRATIEAAFHKAGGRDYLVGVARRRPDVFLALLGKIIPQETRLSVLASYQAMPIAVEQRDTVPAIAAPVPSPALLPVIPGEVLNVTESAETADNWLE